MYDIPIHYANTDAGFESLSQFVVASMRRLRVPGVAVGIQVNDRSLMAGFGVTSVENPLPVTADTLFQIGSTTKTVTGTIIMRLVEQNLIDLDDPVKTYIPEFRLSDRDAEGAVTVRHLLTHMGGWAGDYFSDTGGGDDCLARFVAEMADLPQLVPPGDLWAYNNAGFSLAGRIIEVVTGKTYEEAAQTLVLEPLGMTHSFFFPADVISHRFATGHRVDQKEGPVVLRPWALARAAHSAGGLCSSVRDQLRYSRFHLGDGSAPNGERLLSAESMAAMQTPNFPANLGRQMGLSWILREIDGQKIVQHGGATTGQLSAFLMVPARGFAVTVLTNAEEGGMLHDEVVAWTLDHYLGLREPDPEHRPMSLEELSPYLGVYEAQMTRLELFVENGQLMVRATPLGGFPDKDSPPPPAPPPSRVAFYEQDRAVALDPPLLNSKMEFLRNEYGQLTWLRTSRLFRRV